MLIPLEVVTPTSSLSSPFFCLFPCLLYQICVLLAFQMVFSFLSMALLRYGLLVLLPLLKPVLAQIELYGGVEGINNATVISLGCAQALNRTIDCEPEMVAYVANNIYSSLINRTAIQDSICRAGCTSSLRDYHSSVESACKDDPPPWTGMPATWAGDVLASFQSRMCLKDPSTSLYCTGKCPDLTALGKAFLDDATDVIHQWSSQLGDQDMRLQDLPQAQVCSPCNLALMQNIQNTSFSNYDSNLAEDFSAVYSCESHYRAF